MAIRELRSAPSMLPLYARAAAPMLPGASRLPFVAGGGDSLPDTELVLRDVAIDRDRLGAYARVCGFAPSDRLPATYPHVLAFPMHMALMTDGSFPFGAIGLVHIENAITQHRPVDASETLELRVRVADLAPHPKGRRFSIVTEALAGGEVVWEGLSTMLRRGRGSGEEAPRRAGDDVATSSEWRLADDLGRRYAEVSGDRNPIHMHPLTAKLFGFPRAIAHGMWTKARALAALESELPAAFTVEVAFRRPILLPATVAFGSARRDAATEFAVRDARRDTPHLLGTLTPEGTTP